MIWVYMGTRGFAMCSITKLKSVQNSASISIGFPRLKGVHPNPTQQVFTRLHFLVSVSVIGVLVSKTARLGLVGYHKRWRALEVAKGVKE